MNAAELMTIHPKTLGPTATIQRAAQAMRDEEVDAIPIVDNRGTLIGLITDRDIVVKAIAAGCRYETPIEEYLSRQPVSVSPQASAEQVATLMSSRQIRHLPVVENCLLVGMVTLDSLTASISSGEDNRTGMEDVSIPTGQGITYSRR